MPPFEVVSDFSPAGDQPNAVAALAEGVRRATASRPCSASPAAARAPPSPGRSSRCSGPRWSSPPTSRWPPSWPTSSGSSSRTTGSSTSSPTTTTTSPRPTCPRPTPTSRRTARSTTRSTGCATRPPSALLTRRDVIVVASVSCIYGLGSPEEYSQPDPARCRPGEEHDQRAILRRLVDMQYERNDMNLVRGKFRVRGDTIEVHPAYEETSVRIELFGDEIERIVDGRPADRRAARRARRAGHLPGHPLRRRRRADAAGHRPDRGRAPGAAGLASSREGKLLEAQRLRMRTQYDLEMLAEVGCCSGIENYSRHLDGAPAGRAALHAARLLPRRLPARHRRVPRDRAAAARPVRGRPLPQGDPGRARLPAAVGGRQPAAALRGVLRAGQPVRLPVGHPVALRARSSRPRSSSRSCGPTGLVDPEVVVKPTKGQIDDLIDQINDRVEPGRPGAGHHPHQEDGRGPDRLPARAGPARSATCTPTSTPSSASRSSATCASASSTCWSASTCCGRASTCPRCRWSPSSTPTRRASCAARPR